MTKLDGGRYLSVAISPGVVILHGKAAEGLSVFMDQSFGEFEGEGVSGVWGDDKLAAQDEVSLPIVLIDAADSGVAAKGVAGIERGPYGVVEGVTEMSLEAKERSLSQDLCATIRGVVCVEIGVGVGVEHPTLLGPEWAGDGEFGLERPSIGTEVEKLVGIVLAGGCGDGEAEADGSGGLGVCELLRAERRASFKEYGCGVAGVAGASG